MGEIGEMGKVGVALGKAPAGLKESALKRFSSGCSVSIVASTFIPMSLASTLRHI